MQEVQAYDRVIGEASRFGLKQKEVSLMQQERDLYYRELNPQNRALVDNGNFTTHYP